MILNWSTFIWILDDKIFTKFIQLLSNRLNATHLNDSKNWINSTKFYVENVQYHRVLISWSFSYIKIGNINFSTMKLSSFL